MSLDGGMVASELAIELTAQWQKDLLADRSAEVNAAQIIGASIIFAAAHLGWQIERLTAAVRDIELGRYEE
jgi:hypothetical protein